MPYKRPAPDSSGKPAGMVAYQPTAAAYHQLMQLQSAQQSYVPVSCEYSNFFCSNHALANNTIYPLNTSTATSNANNLHHHPNLYSQTSINACTNSNDNPYSNYQLTIPSNNNNYYYTVRKHDNNNHINHNNINHNNLNTNNNSNDFIQNLNNNNNNLENHASNLNNNNDNPITSTFFADADAQINTNTQPTAHQNLLNQSSLSKATISSSQSIAIDNNALSKNAAVIANATATADDGDSENNNNNNNNNALTVQNAKSSLNNVANGHDVSNGCLSTASNELSSITSEENNNKSKSSNDMSINGANLVVNNDDDAALQTTIETTTSTTPSVQSIIDESN